MDLTSKLHEAQKIKLRTIIANGDEEDSVITTIQHFLPALERAFASHLLVEDHNCSDLGHSRSYIAKHHIQTQTPTIDAFIGVYQTTTDSLNRQKPTTAILLRFLSRYENRLFQIIEKIRPQITSSICKLKGKGRVH